MFCWTLNVILFNDEKKPSQFHSKSLNKIYNFKFIPYFNTLQKLVQNERKKNTFCPELCLVYFIQ